MQRVLNSRASPAGRATFRKILESRPRGRCVFISAESIWLFIQPKEPSMTSTQTTRKIASFSLALVMSA
ncbi:MAG: hypothetical protein RSC66_10775, partial [Comamonas sp.]